MKLLLTFLLLGSLNAFSKVTIVDAKSIELTEDDAKKMTETILTHDVEVTEDAYVLTVFTNGEDFYGNAKKFKTGAITCKKDASNCLVTGSEIRTEGENFGPAKGYVRVFGMGTLNVLDEENDYFKCGAVYVNIACDFKL